MNGLSAKVRVCCWLASASVCAARAAASGEAEPTSLELPSIEMHHPIVTSAFGATVPLTAWHDEAAGNAQIPHHPALKDKFWFGFGAFLSSSTTEARLDSDLGIGTILDLEDVMGLDETTLSPQGLFRWRMSERWRLELEFFQVDRSNTKQTTQDIDWGDVTFPSGSQLKAEFNVSVTRISAGYSFFKTEDKEVGVALGFHLTDLDASLSTSGGSDEASAVLAPLPVLSAYGQVALTDHWALEGRLDAFRLEYDPYKGRIFSMGVDALYQPWDHFGFGFGWRSLHFDLSAEGSDWTGEIGSSFQGPIAFVTVSF